MTAWLASMGTLLGSLKGSPVMLPTVGVIPPSQCTPSESVGRKILEDQTYFTVTVNELFLRNGNKLWTTSLPTVLVVAEFTYGGSKTSVPGLVGPNLIKSQTTMGVPNGLVLHDTTVLGPHPFRGGRLALTVVLYRVTNENHARNVLQCVESVGAAIGVPADVAMLTKVGAAITDALGNLLKLNISEPLAGHRIELDADVYPGLVSSYFVVSTDPQLDVSRLRVRSGRLFYVDDAGAEQKYAGADYVLYSLSGRDRRGNVSTLPFYGGAQEAINTAATPTDESWTSAKALLLSTYLQMVRSDDLIGAEAEELLVRFQKDMEKRRDRGLRFKHLSAGGAKDGQTSANGHVGIASKLMGL